MAYKYHIKQPDPDSHIADHPESGARLYAELADCPLYVHVRVLCTGIVGKRQSFRLGWVIEEKRLAKGHDFTVLPEHLLAWVTEQMAAAYPDHATATGLSADEIAELKAEQSQKRQKYQK